ncbi:MAG TPA: hypothetical protein VI977_01835 [archaeon]|nr:hypothetical protein [archaeon]
MTWMITIPIEIDKGVFVSGDPRSLHDTIDNLRKLGIKRVVSLTERTYTEEALRPVFEAAGIQKVQLKSTGIAEQTYRNIIDQMTPHTLVHCLAGESSSFFAVMYWMKKGLPPKKAIEKITIIFKKHGLEFPCRPFLGNPEAALSYFKKLRPFFWKAPKRKNARMQMPVQRKRTNARRIRR